MNQLTAGTEIREYKLIDLLGRSSMGEVWRATDSTGADVALKTVAYAAPNYNMLRERFLREAANHQALHHPAIVPIREFFEHDGGLYLVMQYIPGGSLEHLLDSRHGRPLPIHQAVSISQQILAALDYAHQHMVIHRDVKPSNILLCDGKAYLADFGISVPIGGPRLTSAQQIVGTRFYMSPEQILQPLSITHLSDVFSYGCVLYEMLTGRQPFAGEGDPESTSDYAAQTRQINANAVPPRQLNPSVPEALSSVVMKALSKQAPDRYPGCASFAKAMDEAMGQPVSVPPVPHEAVAKPAEPPQQTRPHLVQSPPVGPTTAAVLPQRRGSVSLRLYIVPIMLSGLVTLVVAFTTHDEAGATTIAFLSAILSACLLLRLLHKAWASIQDGHARTTPGKAIGLLFVPILALFWCWTALVGFAKDYNAYLGRHSIHAPKCSPGLFGTLAALHFFLPAILSPIGGATALGVWFIGDVFIIAPVLCAALGKAINALPQSAPEKGYAAAAVSA